jgi:hypothetical protein
MALKEDKGNNEVDGSYCGYYDDEDSIYFVNGCLEATAYSYEIGSTGNINLNEEQTLNIYKVMKKHFEKHLLE